MKLKAYITMSAALTASMLTFAGIAAGQDAHERSAGVSGQAAIQYFDANERATLAKSPGVNAIEYFRANELATIAQSGSSGALAGYLDSAQRSDSLMTPPPSPGDAVDGSGFDWGSAAVGASSALMLALLVGGTFATLRRFRTRPLAH